MGYPGNEYYLQYDAETYANWTVDYLKLDGCNSDIGQYDDGKLLLWFANADCGCFDVENYNIFVLLFSTV